MRNALFLLALLVGAWSCGRASRPATLDGLARETIQSLEKSADRPKLEQSLYAIGPASIDAIRDALSDPAYTAKPELIAVLSALPDDRVQPLLQEQLQKRDPNAKRQALQGIAMQQRIPTAERLVAAANSNDEGLREWGLYALGRQGFPEARDLAIRASKDGSAFLRTQAARALRAFNDPDSLSTLRNLVREPDNEVKVEALISLARLAPHDPIVTSAIQKFPGEVGGLSPAGRIEQARMFGEMGPVAEPLLAKLMGDPDPRVRAEAAGAYGRLGRVADTKPLSRAIESDPDKQVRLKAANSIAKLDLPGAIPSIRKLLMSGNPELMRLAAETVIRMRCAEALGPFFLMGNLKDPEMQRYGAIGKMNQGLGDGKFFQLVDGVYADASSTRPEARQDAVGLVGVMPGPKSEAALKKLARDPDEKVRLAAMKWLKYRYGMPLGLPPVRLHPLPSWNDFER